MKSYTLLLVAAAGIAAASCGSRSADADAAPAALLEQAEACVNTDPATSIALLDSLSKTYRTETALVKQAMALRPRAIEQLTLREIATADSLLEANKHEIETLRGSLRWVKEPRMVDGYYIARTVYNPDFMNTTGIEARVTDIGRFYVVSSANPGNGHTSVTITDGSASATTGEVPYDGESNYRIGGGEVVTYSPEKSDTLGAFAAQASGPLTLRFNGRGKSSRKLSARDVEAIAVAYRYSKAVENARNADIEQQRLRKQLEIARSQQQRLADKTANDS